VYHAVMENQFARSELLLARIPRRDSRGLCCGLWLGGVGSFVAKPLRARGSVASFSSTTTS
jgi:hypothetical protein